MITANTRTVWRKSIEPFILSEIHLSCQKKSKTSSSTTSNFRSVFKSWRSKGKSCLRRQGANPSENTLYSYSSISYWEPRSFLLSLNQEAIFGTSWFS